MTTITRSHLLSEEGEAMSERRECPDCGCGCAIEMDLSFVKVPAHIVYCPLHAAAPALRDALELLLETVRAGATSPMAEAQAEAALSAAKGEE